MRQLRAGDPACEVSVFHRITKKQRCHSEPAVSLPTVSFTASLAFQYCHIILPKSPEEIHRDQSLSSSVGCPKHKGGSSHPLLFPKANISAFFEVVKSHLQCWDSKAICSFPYHHCLPKHLTLHSPSVSNESHRLSSCEEHQGRFLTQGGGVSCSACAEHWQGSVLARGCRVRVMRKKGFKL